MNKSSLSAYWDDIPTGIENAVSYTYLCIIWRCTERAARKIPHNLSCYDNGDDYVLIRSGKRKDFTSQILRQRLPHIEKNA